MRAEWFADSVDLVAMARVPDDIDLSLHEDGSSGRRRHAVAATWIAAEARWRRSDGTEHETENADGRDRVRPVQ